MLQVMQLLLIMRQDSRPLPQELSSLVDEDGHSFFAAWLHDFLSARHLDRKNEGKLRAIDDQQVVTCVCKQ